ncbi:MAG TPA: NAD(P)H-dependent glycerol-3-phosphate dehydrogenase [Thermomicrobiales bacterium]|nr:NAD(P)H-dependent glycerol-3-phosphate dehydrogenase [Thermomicrobiales bacterium]
MSITASSETSISNETIAIIGAGAWGTTLATLCASAGHRTTLVAHSSARATALRATRVNEVYLPGFALSDHVDVTDQLERAVTDSTLVLIVVPTIHVRSVARQLRECLDSVQIITSCAKGFELGSLLRMTEVISEETGLPGEQVCALSGPNLAREIAAGMPASTVVASRSAAAAERVQRALTSPAFRVYTSRDVVGVEYGGALKNVIALGAGAVDGLEAGQNAKAALVTRGLAEMTRLGVAAGASAMTFGGLSGLGDLLATCESPLSRNRTFGERLGRGVPTELAAGDSPHVVEGITATSAAVQLSMRYGVDMPIAHAILDVLEGRATVRDAVVALMTRASRSESDGDDGD